MKSKRLLLIIGSACLVLMLAMLSFMTACAQPAPTPAPTPSPTPTPTPTLTPTPAPFEPMEIKFGTYTPSGDTQTQEVFIPFGEAVTERTGGRLTVKTYPDGVLATGPEQPDAVLAGQLDIAYHTTGYTPGRFPAASVVELPALFPDVVMGTAANLDMLRRGWWDKDIQGFKILGTPTFGTYQLFTRKQPIRTLEDLKGKTVRTSGDVQSMTIEALGGTPAMIPAPELYISFERGVIDVVAAGWAMGPMYGFVELTDYVTEANLFMVTCPVFMNQEVWDSLPHDIQFILEQTSAEFFSVRLPASWNYGHTRAKADFAAAGAETIHLTPEEQARWFEKMTPVYAQWHQDMEANGYDAKGMLEDLLEIRETMALDPLPQAVVDAMIG